MHIKTKSVFIGLAYIRTQNDCDGAHMYERLLPVHIYRKNNLEIDTCNHDHL